MARNLIPDDYKDHLKKFAPVLRSYGLDRAADYLLSWSQGNLDQKPLLDISARLPRRSDIMTLQKFL